MHGCVFLNDDFFKVYYCNSYRDWNCDVASLSLLKMRKFKSSILEKKQETDISLDHEKDENLEDEDIKT